MEEVDKCHWFSPNLYLLAFISSSQSAFLVTIPSWLSFIKGKGMGWLVSIGLLVFLDTLLLKSMKTLTLDSFLSPREFGLCVHFHWLIHSTNIGGVAWLQPQGAHSLTEKFAMAIFGGMVCWAGKISSGDALPAFKWHAMLERAGSLSSHVPSWCSLIATKENRSTVKDGRRL